MDSGEGVTERCLYWSSARRHQPTTKWSSDFAIKPRFLVLVSHSLVSGVFIAPLWTSGLRVSHGARGGEGHRSGPSLPSNLPSCYILFPCKKCDNSESLCGRQPIRGQRESPGGGDWLPGSPVNHSCSKETDFFQDVTRREETTS